MTTATPRTLPHGPNRASIHRASTPNQARKRLAPALVLAMLAITGCAGIEATPVDPKVQTSGFRYYDTSPFILVYTDNKGGLVSTLIYMPDTTKMRQIKPYSYLATNKTTLTFSNGVLTQAKAEVDETAVPKAAIAGLQQVATAIVKAANAPDDDSKLEVPAPYIFRVIKKEGKWMLAGGQGKNLDDEGVSIRVTVVK